MARTHVQTREFLASRLNFLITTPEVLRLVHDITTCTVEWLDHPDLEALEPPAAGSSFPASPPICSGTSWKSGASFILT